MMILGLLLLAVPYVLFPAIVLIMHAFTPKPRPIDLLEDVECPSVDVVVAAYNEEGVLGSLIESLLNSDYPADKLRLWVGSDRSTDGTDRLVQEWMKKTDRIQLLRTEGRTGKSGIINQLVQRGNSEVIVGTDANIVFAPDALRRLASTLAGRKAGLVGGRLVYRQPTDYNSSDTQSIATEERQYTRFESNLKQAESDLFGATMGVEGGCYAVRRSLWTPIPPATFMEDFFISMHVLKEGESVLWEESACAFEDVSVDRREEFARKIRISLGNFQNLARFWPLVFLRPVPLGIVFLCHKILRWIFPLIALVLLVLALMLEVAGMPSTASRVVLTGGILAAFSWGSLYVWPPSWRNPGKALGYFTLLNVALILGLVRYLRGVQSSVWTPTKRTS